jgi:hypothetical protein
MEARMTRAHQDDRSQQQGAGGAPRTDQRRPYEVSVDSIHRSAFRDLHDAIDAAKISKRDRPLSHVSVRNVVTGQILVEID